VSAIISVSKCSEIFDARLSQCKVHINIVLVDIPFNLLVSSTSVQGFHTDSLHVLSTNRATILVHITMATRVAPGTGTLDLLVVVATALSSFPPTTFNIAIMTSVIMYNPQNTGLSLARFKCTP
jgi:hypothetical protein